MLDITFHDRIEQLYGVFFIPKNRTRTRKDARLTKKIQKSEVDENEEQRLNDHSSGFGNWFGRIRDFPRNPLGERGDE